MVDEELRKPMLSVIVPAYNEASVVERTVQSLAAALEAAAIDYEILCVNNNSSDETEHILAHLTQTMPHVRYVNTPPIAGYGVAVRWGLRNYRGDAAVIVMADGADSPEDVVKYYQKISEGCDCAFGSRFVPGASVKGYPPIKLLLNRVGNVLIAALTGVRYNDFTNGFKCYRRHVLDAIEPLVGQYFNLTIEMSMGAVLSGARFSVVPNDWKNRSAGASKFAVFRQAWLYLMTIAYVLLAHRLKRDTQTFFIGKQYRTCGRSLNNGPVQILNGEEAHNLTGPVGR